MFYHTQASKWKGMGWGHEKSGNSESLVSKFFATDKNFFRRLHTAPQIRSTDPPLSKKTKIYEHKFD